MPTGFTQPLCDGDPQTFQQFVVKCARAFNAFIEVREQPNAAPIPSRFEADIKYYTGTLKRALSRYARVKKMTREQIFRASELEWKRANKAREKRILAVNDIRYRYADMLEQVMQWTPPTEDHEPLKKLMIQQLTESIDFDTRPEPPLKAPLSIDEWRSSQLKALDREIAYFERRIAEEIERARFKTEWVQGLLSSLGIEFTDELVSVR